MNNKCGTSFTGWRWNKTRVHPGFGSWNICFLSTGPPLPRSRFAVAVNWTGILFVEGKDKKLLELPYIKIKAVHVTRYWIIHHYLTSHFNCGLTKVSSKRNVFNVCSDGHFGAQSVRVVTVGGEYVLECEEAADMTTLVGKHLDGLRERSVYAMVQQDTGKSSESRQHVGSKNLCIQKNNTHSLSLSLVVQVTPCSWSVNGGTCSW